MLGNLIGGFIAILVGSSLIGTVANQVATFAQNESNVTGAAYTIINLTTLFYALGIMSAGLAVTAQGLRAAGVLGM